MQSTKRVREQLLADLQELRQAMARDLFAAPMPAVGGREVTVAQMGALMLLADREPRSLKEIAGALGRSVSATSRLVDLLVQGGAIHRREDPDDRRARRIEITDDGLRLLSGFAQRRADAQLAVMEMLTEDERARVLEAMALLAAAARRRRGVER